MQIIASFAQLQAVTDYGHTPALRFPLAGPLILASDHQLTPSLPLPARALAAAAPFPLEPHWRDHPPFWQLSASHRQVLARAAYLLRAADLTVDLVHILPPGGPDGDRGPRLRVRISDGAAAFALVIGHTHAGHWLGLTPEGPASALVETALQCLRQTPPSRAHERRCDFPTTTPMPLLVAYDRLQHWLGTHGGTLRWAEWQPGALGLWLALGPDRLVLVLRYGTHDSPLSASIPGFTSLTARQALADWLRTLIAPVAGPGLAGARSQVRGGVRVSEAATR